MARASYIAPAVVDAYTDGHTLADFRPRVRRVVRPRGLDLDPEEGALLSLLRSARALGGRRAA